MESKELPSEYVSIRQIWLKRIDDCGKAISSEALNEATDERETNLIGAKSVCHAVNALYHSLVDYGQALIRTEVAKHFRTKIAPDLDKIWGKPEVNEKDFQSTNAFADKNDLSYQEKWRKTALVHIELYDGIIQTLNKYNMLFESQPQGYSNVIMESI